MTEYLPAPEPVSPFQTTFDEEDDDLSSSDYGLLGVSGEFNNSTSSSNPYSAASGPPSSRISPSPSKSAGTSSTPISESHTLTPISPSVLPYSSTMDRSSTPSGSTSNGTNRNDVGQNSSSTQQVHSKANAKINIPPQLPTRSFSTPVTVSSISAPVRPNPVQNEKNNTPLQFKQPQNSSSSKIDPPKDRSVNGNITNVKSWTSKEIKEWLESIHCGEYFQCFEDNHITGDVLLECDQKALTYLGIRKVGDRLRINQSLKALRIQHVAAVSGSLTYLDTKQYSRSRSLEDLDRNSISPFAALISPSSGRLDSNSTPIDGYFSPKPSSSELTDSSLGIVSGSISRFPFRRGLNNTKSPPPATTTTVLSKSQPSDNNVQEIFSMDVVKQNNLKFIYPQGESKTVNIAGCMSADEIKTKALHKIMPDNVANPVDWIVFVAIDDKYRHLGDAELMSISQSAESLERRRLMLCAIGTSPSTKQLEKSKQIQASSHLSLPSLSDMTVLPVSGDATTISNSRKSVSSTNRLSLAQSIAATSYADLDDDDLDDESMGRNSVSANAKPRPRKLGRLSEHRPPSELISSNLAHFFPSAPSNDLEETIRNSKRFSKRMSRLSRISHRMSVASSTWGIPEDEEAPPPVPSLPTHDSSDVATITPGSLADLSPTVVAGTTISTENKRLSIRNSFRKSVLSRRSSTQDSSGNNVLSALSNRISTISLNKGRSKNHDESPYEEEEVVTPKIEKYSQQDKSDIIEESLTVESEIDEDDGDEDDNAFLATARREESCPTKWIKGRLIGSGSFGTVYLGMNSFTGELMAVKQVEISTGDNENGQRKKSMVDALQREMNLLRELHHENIVQYLGSNSEGNFLNIFLEYVPGGSVAMLLSNYGVFEESLIRNFVRQILQGLKYLHEQQIIHRDIKGANVLVDNKGCIKISDFGISKKIETKLLTNNRVSLQGSVFWMAPEVVKQLPYTLKADIWSLGCLIVEMYSGTHPFPEFTQMQVIFRLGNSGTPAIPDDCSTDAKDFLMKTFAIDHEKRPTAAELLNHPFMEQISQ